MDTTCLWLREESMVKYEDQGVADTNQTAYTNGDNSEQLATPTVDLGIQNEEREQMRTETNKPIRSLKSAGTTKWQK